LLILLGGLVAAALFGPAISVAMFIGQTRIAVTSLAIGITTNACLSLWLTPIFGARGAAVATAGGMIVAATIGYILLIKRSGLNAAAVIVSRDSGVSRSE